MAKRSDSKTSAVFRKFRSWTSCVRWATWLTSCLNRLVRRKIIICFGLFEIFVCLGCFCFLLRNRLYKSLWPLLQVNYYARYLVPPALVLRMISGGFVVIAAFKRNSRLMRYYFAILFVNTCTTTIMMGPLGRTSCQCKNFYQCDILLAFMGKSRELVNPFPGPGKKWLEFKRAVPYRDPPMSPAKAEKQRQQKKKGRRLHDLPKFELEYGRNQDILEGQSVDRQFPAAVRTEREAHRRLNPERQSDAGSPDELYSVFDVTGENISWAPAHPAREYLNCYKYPLSIRVYEVLLEQFLNVGQVQVKSIVDAVQSEHPGHIALVLSTCRHWKLCAVVQAMLMHDVGNATLQICQLPKPAVPIPKHLYVEYMERRFPKSELVSSMLAIYFQKNSKKVREYDRNVTGGITDQRQQNSKGYMIQVLGLDDESSRRQHMDEYFMDSCRCRSRADSDGCATFYDRESSTVRYWCEVAADSLQACLSNRYRVYEMPGDDQVRYWTMDLCTRSGCKCSELGMIPDLIDPKYKTGEPNKTLLYFDNGTALVSRELVYGTKCDSWDVNDLQNKRQWCFVGYDSTCPDRVLVKSSTPIDPTKSRAHMVTHQYRSVFACPEMKKRQEKLMISSKELCQLTIASVLVTMILLTLASLPMAVIVFKFLVRRCGDHFTIEAQFDAYFSSESENEDDFITGDFSNSAGFAAPFQQKHSGKSRSTVAGQTVELADLTGRNLTDRRS